MMLTVPSEHKRKFREWRKKHYDEFFAVKRAREHKKVRKSSSIIMFPLIVLAGSETERRGRR